MNPLKLFFVLVCLLLLFFVHKQALYMTPPGLNLCSVFLFPQRKNVYGNRKRRDEKFTVSFVCAIAISQFRVFPWCCPFSCPKRLYVLLFLNLHSEPPHSPLPQLQSVPPRPVSNWACQASHPSLVPQDSWSLRSNPKSLRRLDCLLLSLEPLRLTRYPILCCILRTIDTVA